MPEVLGVATILRNALPAGIDGTRAAQWRLKGGITYQQWITQVSQALAGLNTELDQRWGEFMFLTEDDLMEYPNGGSVTPMQEITDTDRPSPKHASTVGHMLPLIPYGDAIGGSRRFFRDARQSQIDADVTRIANAGRWRFEIDLLTRIFHNTENLIGTSGYDVPFAGGSGMTVSYTPPAYGGEAFASSHNHYVGYDTSTYGFGSMLDSMVEHLQEHGHEPPYIALVSRADVASYKAQTDFIEPLGGTPIVMIDQGGITQDRPVYFSRETPGEMGLIGHYNSDFGLVAIRVSNRIPTGYAGVTKSYGRKSERNPIAVRVHPAEGFGFQLMTETTPDNRYPLKQLNVEFECGVGVGRDRTNFVLGRLVSGGAWANPTIS